MKNLQLKEEAFHVHNVLLAATRALQQINSPEKINADIMKEFKNRSRSINLVSLDKGVLTSKVIFFDKKYLFVRVPPNFESNVGELILLEFPTSNGNYVIQSFVSTVKSPILCLKFHDPRKDSRFFPSQKAIVSYTKVGSTVGWLNEDQSYIIRSMEEANENDKEIIIRDAIGTFEKEGDDGKKVFSTSEKETDALRGSMTEAELNDISIGGFSFNTKDNGIEKSSMIYLSFNLTNDNYTIRKVELSLFGIVRNVFQLDDDRFRYGISFIKRILIDPFDRFLKEMNTK